MEDLTSQNSSLVKSFWAGVLLRKLKSGTPSVENVPTGSEPGLSSLSSVERDAQHNLTVKDTSLSPSVHKLLTEDPGFSQTDLTGALDHCNGTLNWSFVANYFDEEQLVGESKAAGLGDLVAGAGKCKILAKYVYERIYSDEELIVKLQDISSFNWTSQPQVLSECVRVLLAPPTDGGVAQCVSTCLLKITSVLERSLGDVFLALSGSKQCPSLLRDLLVKEELVSKSPIAMYLLQCLIGPPQGLNLRNLCWHGFLQHDQVPRESVWHPTVLQDLTATRRPFISFPEQEAILKNTFPDLSGSYCAIHSIFTDSFFILPSMLATWRAALEAFKLNNYGECLVILLPCLEHSLRRVFACVNKCPHRILTAEANTLYTTLDEILAPKLPDQTQNKLIEEMGAQKMEMLLDLLVHPEGPRVRDRISHGEVLIEGVSRLMANHLLAVCTLFCCQFSIGAHPATDEVVQQTLLVSDHYQSLFHPFSVLKREVEEFKGSLEKWETTPFSCLPPPSCSSDSEGLPEAKGVHKMEDVSMATNLVSRLHTLICDGLTSLRGGHFVPDTSDLMGVVIPAVWSSVSTLFVAREQLELAAILRRIVQHANKAALQICETATSRQLEMQKKDLRSRQRANYSSLLASMPLYAGTCRVLLALVVLSMLKMQKSCQGTIKYHKKVLQFTENFHSQTSPSRNRWLEAGQLCHTFLTLVHQSRITSS